MPGPQARIDGKPCDGPMGESPLNEGLQRRQVLALGSAAMAACCFGASGSAFAADPALAAKRPQKGDWLVIADEGEHEGKVITLDMLSVGGAMMNAWPVDAETKTTRSKSRFNKVVVVRVDERRVVDAHVRHVRPRARREHAEVVAVGAGPGVGLDHDFDGDRPS